MIKNHVSFTITSIIVTVFFTGCKNAADDVFRTVGKQGNEIIRPVKNQGDEVIETFDNQGSKAAIIASKQSDQILNRCKLEAKEAVKTTLKQAVLSKFEISQDDLTQIAKNAAQKCAGGKFGDLVLDQLANDAVTKAQQEYQSEYEFSN